MSSAPPLSYEAAIREALPRVLSMLDREPMSKTFGCADRVFWSWKFTDFPGARFQEIAYVLADLATSPSPAFLRERVGERARDTLTSWAKAAIAYWRTLQHGDGSFDEAYPYERSLAATAFTGFYVGQAFLKLRDSYTAEEQATWQQVFRKAGEWLLRNDERHGVLSNHLAAAAAALQTIVEITSDARFAVRRDYFISRILQRQSEEGWYEEYGGADMGYQTHTTFYLGYIWMRTRNSALLDSLVRSVRYFWHFVHADGSLGGEYGSRNTRFFMPAGFEILAGVVPEAAAVAAFMRRSIAAQTAVGLAMMDMYNVFPLLNNYCFAQAFATPLATANLPFHSTGVTLFEKSGHMVISTPAYQAIIGLSKGGVISAFAKMPDGASWCDSGVAVEFADGKKASSQGLHCSTWKHAGNSMEIEAEFMAINQMVMSPFKFAVFRAVNVTSIICPTFSYYLKWLLVKLLVRRKKSAPVRLRRRIMWDAGAIQVEDEIELTQMQPIARVWRGGRFSAVHMGSSRYFEWQELKQNPMPELLAPELLRQLNAAGKILVKREWSV